MPVIALLLLALLAFIVPAGNRSSAFPSRNAPTATQPAPRQGSIEGYGKVPLSFEANQGQTDPRVKFISRGSGYTLYLTRDEAVLALRSQKSEGRPWSLVPGHLQKTGAQGTRDKGPGTKDKGPGTTDVLRMKLVGANQAAKVTALGELPGKSNYFIGNDPKKWRTDVPTYGKVKYEGVYPGIDLVYYGNQRQLEYDFVVAPGADPKAVTLAIENGNSRFEIRNSKIAIDADGDLVITTDGGEVRFHKPVVYQEQVASGKRSAPAANRQSAISNRKLLEGRYVLTADNRITFEIPSYDKTRPLVIDPVLVYSTYLGGSLGASGSAIAVDSSGSAYVTGATLSPDFPTTANAFQTTFAGSWHAFVTKFRPDGRTLVYSTYLGGSQGSGEDGNSSIAVDSAGNAYVTGTTGSSDFPLAHAFQSSSSVNGNCGDYTCTDAFVTKLGAGGDSLVYSTYLGGSSIDRGSAIAVDSSGSAYVTGSTSSTDFPTANAVQPRYASTSTSIFATNAFVTKFAPNGSSLAYSTYLGGGNSDGSSAIAVDSSGSAYVTGQTISNDFPTTPNALQPNLSATDPYSGENAFVTKFTPDGSRLAYSTYLGGSVYDNGSGIAADSSGNAYVTGTTRSANFPTTANAFQPGKPAEGCEYPPCAIAFVTKIGVSGDALVYSTFLGGTYGTPDSELGGTGGRSIGVDPAGNAYVTGSTSSIDFPTTNAIQASYEGGDDDAFVTALTADGSHLIYSTFIGGSRADAGNGIAVDSSGNAYVVGWTESLDFPTANPFQSTLSGYSDSFVVKIGSANAPAASFSPASLSFNNQGINTMSPPQAITVSNRGTSPLVINQITFTGASSGDFAETDNCGTPVAGGASCAINVTFTPSTGGTESAAVSVADNAAGTPQTVPLSGTGSTNSVTLSPAFLNFGFQPPGTSSPPKTVTLSTKGTGTVTINSVAITGPGGNEFAQTNNCPKSMPAGSSCAISVTYAPTGSNTANATLTVNDSAVGSPQAVGLTGTSAYSVVPTGPPTHWAASDGYGAYSNSSVAVSSISSGTFWAFPGSVVVVYCGSGNPEAGTPTVTDTLGNTFVQVGATVNASGQDSLSMFYAGNAIGSGYPLESVTCHWGAASNNLAVMALEYWGTLDVTASGSTQGGTTLKTGPFSTTSPNEIIVAGMMSSACGPAPTPGSGYIMEINAKPYNCAGPLAAVEDQGVSTPQAGATASMSVPSGTYADMIVATFKIAPAASGPGLVQVQNNIDTTTTAHASFSVPITTHPGNLLVAFVRESSNSTDNFTMTDSAGQTWTQTPSGYKNESSTGPRIGMFYIANSAAVTSVTAKYSTPGGVIKPGIIVMEITGAPSSAVLDGSVNGGTNANVTGSGSGSMTTMTTTNANNILIFATDTWRDQTSWTNGWDYAIPNNRVTTGASGSNIRMAVQYNFLPSGGWQTSMTYPNWAGNGNIFAAFKLGSPTTSNFPAVSLAPASLTLGSETVGTTSAAQTVTLTNTGTAALSISSISIAGTNSQDFAEKNNCGTSVAVGASCRINVTFTPTASGWRNAFLSVADNASFNPQVVSLQGTGAPPFGANAVVQVQNNIDTSATNFYTSLTVNITTNPGDLLVAFCRESSNTTDNFTVTDSNGQGWALTSSGYVNEANSSPRIAMFYRANSAAVTSVTVHYTTPGGVIKPGIMVMEISGAAVSGVLDNSATNASGASVTTSSSASLSTTNANDILIFATDTAANQVPNANTSGGWMAGPGYAIPSNNLVIGASGSNQRMAMQFKIVSSTQSAVKTSMTYANSAWNGNIFAAFK